MSTIVTRSGKGSPLTHNEVDTNFINLNTDKVEKTAADITGGTINNTTIGATTPSTGVFTTLTATGQTDLGLNGSNNQTFRATAGSGAFPWVQSTHASGNARLRAVSTAGNVDFWLSSTGTGAVRFYTNANTDEQFRVANTTSAVNYVQVTGAATGNSPIISAQGSDTNAGLWYYTKGFGGHRFYGYGGSSIFGQFYAAQANPVNYLQLGASSSGNALPIQAVGSDTNIAQVLQPKGTGAIDLAAGSSGVNISNGGTVTAITRTAGGGSYTSTPTVVISAPTTAGGVQATATTTISTTGTPTIVSGGTGYTVNDVLTIVGGTPVNVAATMTVTAVSGGVITAASYTNFAQYTVAPTGTISVTGGTGTGATFNISFAVTTAFTITNAGSGYVEQPTVTFSGGGGSGAAAYATVGSGSVIRALGATGSQSLSFFMPGGEGLRIRDTGGSADTYPMISPSSALTTFVAQGNANASMFVGANGSGSVRFSTNGTSVTEQLRVAHTASAVNYVQVTGAATGSASTISAQGSDANIGLVLTSKGTNPLYLQTVGSTDVRIQPNNLRSFSVSSVASAVNYGVWTNSAAGFAPSLAVAGTDTNIDLTLTPKGTGNVRFGTYTASMALTIQGYVEIKDAGGTIRKLAVIA